MDVLTTQNRGIAAGGSARPGPLLDGCDEGVNPRAYTLLLLLHADEEFDQLRHNRQRHCVRLVFLAMREHATFCERVELFCA